MITALVLFALAVVIGFVGMLYEVATRRPGLALKSRAERENPMSAGCEMDIGREGLSPAVQARWPAGPSDETGRVS